MFVYVETRYLVYEVFEVQTVTFPDIEYSSEMFYVFKQIKVVEKMWAAITQSV